MLVTPVQMAMVAATVANGGVLMQPHLLDSVRAPNGDVVTRVKPHKVRRAISPQDRAGADADDGVGRHRRHGDEPPDPAASGSPARPAPRRPASPASTTRGSSRSRRRQTPKVAVAVALENQTGFGATTAGPIAKSLMEAILAEKVEYLGVEQDGDTTR